MAMYKFKVVYNTNFWGSKKASGGYIFAESDIEARRKLENKYGKIDYKDLSQSYIISFDIRETDIITLD